MFNITLQRYVSNTACTPGLMSGDYSCLTLEPIVREVSGVPIEQWKIHGRTAIPQGRYQILMEFSPKFNRFMPHLQDVPGFSAIMIHPLNFPNETEGCIGVGQSMDKAQTTLFSSRAAFEPLNEKIQKVLDDGQEVWISVVNA